MVLYILVYINYFSVIQCTRECEEKFMIYAIRIGLSIALKKFD
jgi:hypothetical protein